MRSFFWGESMQERCISPNSVPGDVEQRVLGWDDGPEHLTDRSSCPLGTVGNHWTLQWG